MRIDKIASGAEYRMYDQFLNFLMFGILIIFQIKKKIWIPKITNLENSQNL